MRALGIILRSLSKLAQGVLSRPWGRLTVIIIPLVLWLAGVPVLRLCYGALVLPLRSVQFQFSSDRKDAQKLYQLAGFPAEYGAVRAYLDQLGLWAVLRELRAERLELKQQAMALAIVYQESRFRFYVKNRQSTACGLYQMVAATGQAKNLAWWRCMDPIANTRAGTRLFQEVAVMRSGDFAALLRCAYLKHYYGAAHGCSSDPQGIWKRVSSRMVSQGVIYLKALQRIEADHRKASALRRFWSISEPYFSMLLLIILIFGLRRILRSGHSARP